ncbi:MAG: alpha/beta hydrolase [Bacteroidetes bacterium]|nr:alpha/beta hydrolase [Bacteroidota bacterium]
MNYTEGFINVSSGNVYYKIINPQITDKPFLVFLHEGLGCSEQWKDFPQLISNSVGCPALLYDRLKYGKSDYSEAIVDSNYMHDEAFEILPKVLENLNIKGKIILIGHSDGGTISLLYASKNNDKVAAVITEADHVVCEEITTGGVRKVVGEYEKGWLKEMLTKYHKEKTEKLFRGWSGFWLSEDAEKWTIEPHLRNIKVPVLAIQGKEDRYGSEEQLIVKLMNITGDVNITFLENCGHIPHHELKENVLHKMIAFIESEIK